MGFAYKKMVIFITLVFSTEGIPSITLFLLLLFFFFGKRKEDGFLFMQRKNPEQKARGSRRTVFRSAKGVMTS